jgi:hypothetical protein
MVMNTATGSNMDIVFDNKSEEKSVEVTNWKQEMGMVEVVVATVNEFLSIFLCKYKMIVLDYFTYDFITNMSVQNTSSF